MRIIEVKLYQFDELSDKAKEKAREWWRLSEGELFGAHGELYEPYETAAKLLGIEFSQRPVPLMSGKTRYEPAIFWQLHVQGSGASFDGTYSYAKDCSKKIREEFPTDTKLHSIVDGLVALQKKNGYKLTATVKADRRAVHQYAMHADVSKGDDYADDDTSTDVQALMRDFAGWIYKGISDEWDAHMEDEYVDDAITANEYEFYEDGRRAA